MIDWETVIVLLSVPASAIAIGLWVLYINREPLRRRSSHRSTPAE